MGRLGLPEAGVRERLLRGPVADGLEHPLSGRPTLALSGRGTAVPGAACPTISRAPAARLAKTSHGPLQRMLGGIDISHKRKYPPSGDPWRTLSFDVDDLLGVCCRTALRRVMSPAGPLAWARHELDPVPLADCRHLGQVVRNRADLAIYIFEKRGRMSGHSKNEHSRRRRRSSLKGMHSVARQVSETARFDAHRLRRLSKSSAPSTT